MCVSASVAAALQQQPVSSSLDAEIERLRTPVELRLWILKTGDHVLLMHMSWSILTLAHIYARALVARVTRCSNCVYSLTMHPERDLQVALSPPMKRYITIAPPGASVTLAAISATLNRMWMCSMLAAAGYAVSLLARHAVITLGTSL